MNDIRPRNAGSPFDAIRRTREDGTEYWSARDLADLMQYEQWRNFASAIDRARMAAQNQGYRPEDHIADASKMVDLGSGAGELPASRFGRSIRIARADLTAWAESKRRAA